jgi:hypothetical protein
LDSAGNGQRGLRTSGGDRSGGSLGHCGKKVIGIGRLGQPAAEVGQRFVGLRTSAVRRPVGQSDDAAAQRLEG